MRRRDWRATAVMVVLGALTMGSCTGALIGRYTVTGIMPLASAGIAAPVPAVPDTDPRDPLFE